METIVKRALARMAEEESPTTRFRLSGTTRSDVDYYKLAEEEFGFDLRKAKIMVVGVGGAGGNSVTRIMELGIEGATTLSLNTDAKALAVAKAHKKILIGKELTKGLGCGGYPEVGKKAAEESRNEIKEALSDVDLVFVLAGLGKGTGGGATPVVCELAKNMGAIVISVLRCLSRSREQGSSRLRKASPS